MATSGSRDFNLDVAEIIEEAYGRCGLEMRTGYDTKTARRSLNLMFAEWMNRGLNLWTVAQGTTTTVAGTATYTLDADVADLLEVVLRRDGTDYELARISRGDYLYMPNKTDQGRPSQFYLDRQVAPVLQLWQTPENSTDQVVYYYVRRIEDVDSLTNTAALPYRFLPCMVAGLAYYLSLKRSPDRTAALKMLYEEEFARASEEDEDRVSLFATPAAAYRRV